MNKSFNNFYIQVYRAMFKDEKIIAVKIMDLDDNDLIRAEE